MEETTIQGSRWSGSDWASETRSIYVIGIGGIGSWLTMSLSRINHSLIIVDGDVCDVTNVGGGQLFRTKDIGKSKVSAIQEICREFGCANHIDAYEAYYDIEGFGGNDIMMCGVDNMKARKEIFKGWLEHLEDMSFSDQRNSLFVDGRLLLENMEIFTIRGDDDEAITEYQEKHLFSDEEVVALDCTAKQTTFSAMMIAGMMTGTLCNFLTNRKLNMDFRELPFLQKFYVPLLKYDKQELAQEALV